jgi:cytochrome P450
MERLKEIIEQRRKNPKATEDSDVTGALMKIKELDISDDDLPYILLTLMFASYVSTSPLIQMAIEYLYNYPEVHQRILVNHHLCFQEMENVQCIQIEYKGNKNQPYNSLCIPFFILDSLIY